MIGGYQAQFHRMLRQLELAMAPGSNLCAKEDECINVFLHAWTLKDHIKKDTLLPQDVRDRLVQAAENKSNTILKIASQIANGTKHLTPHPAKMLGHNDVTVIPDSHIEQYPLITFDDGTQRRAVHVAQDVVAEWRRLFASENIQL